MDEPEQNGHPGPRGLRAHLVRALRRAIVLFALLAIAVGVMAIATDGVPHLPFDYAGFD